MLCLDIKHNAIYSVFVNKTKHGIRVLDRERIAIDMNHFFQQPDAMRDFLQPMLKKYKRLFGWQQKIVTLCLPSSLSIVQKIRLSSALSDADIIQEVNLYLRERLGLTNEPLAIDFVRGKSKQQQDDIDIHFAAIREFHLQPWYQLFRHCGFHLKIVDLDSYALSRVMLNSTSMVREEIVANIVMQDDTATCILFNNEDVLFYETWDYPKHGNPRDQWQYIMRQGQWLSLHPVKKIFLYDMMNTVEFEWLTAELKRRAIEVCHLPWQRLFRPANDFAIAQDPMELPSEFAFACGLSLREIPRW